ncbi:hypothetical protein [uncultured Sphingomonas sp.]|uniref:hypothetical protein n=1 Tax=uncultured Sphingomonas sp. TaxID=158754 RepID=UPI0035CB6E7C
MEITQPKGGREYFAFGIEMPEPVFRACGGAVRMMALRGLVPSVESVPASRRAQIAAAPLARRIAFSKPRRTSNTRPCRKDY